MVQKRKADVFAGKGSFAGKLKARRQRIESGNLTGSKAPMKKAAKKKAAKKKYKLKSPYAD